MSTSRSVSVSSRKGSAAVAAILGALAVAAPSPAYESDQYSNRLEPIADAAPELGRTVDVALRRIAARWRGGADPSRFAHEVYREIGGLHWVDRIERLAMKSSSIEKLPQFRWRSIFHGAPFWATRVNFVFGVGATIRLGDTLVGSDKLGHFVSQGLKYYRSHLAGWSEQRIAGRGRFNERWIFGQLTTSVYSNADLVANFEGYRFFRSLFESGIVPGKGPLVEFAGGRAAIRRRFAWSDHVNDYWDEALNPSFLSPALASYFRARLPELCGEFDRKPAAFVPAAEASLRERYAPLGLREAVEFRLDHVCDAPSLSLALGPPARGGRR